MSQGMKGYEYDQSNNGNEKNNGSLKSPMARRFRGYLPVVI